MDTATLFGITSAVLFVCAIIAFIVKKAKTSKIESASRLSLDSSFNKMFGSLSIDRRDSKYSNLIAIKPHKLQQHSYNPEKLHYGSVTVGGVTSGGFYKMGGNYYSKDYSDGKYKLVYKTINQNGQVMEDVIKKITLSDKLTEQALNSNIKNYVSGNSIIVVEDINGSAEVAALMRTGQRTAAVNLLEVEQAKGYPSKEKCEEILNWLCDKKL